MFIELQGQHSDLWLQTDSLLLQPADGGQDWVDFRSTRDTNLQAVKRDLLQMSEESSSSAGRPENGSSS